MKGSRALLVGGDLMARARLEQAASRRGFELRTVPSGALVETLRAGAADVVVLDLDSGGRALLEEVEGARVAGVLPERVVGYFSHVDDELGRAAADRGCRALPRGRFWRTLDDVFSPPESRG